MANRYVLKCPRCGATDNLHMDDPENDLFIDCLNCNNLTEFEHMDIEEQ